MKITLICFTGSITCYQGDGQEASICTDTSATKCSYPKFKEHTGFVDAYVKYGCGCEDAQRDISCEECDGIADEEEETENGFDPPTSMNPARMCNMRLKTTEYKCFEYTWSEDLVLWEPAAAMVKCHKLVESKTKCNKYGSSQLGIK